MSYCRFTADSDVYLYPSQQGIVCCACSLAGKAHDTVLATSTAAIEHLDKHRTAGERVPERAYVRLREEERERARAAQPVRRSQRRARRGHS